MLRRRTLCQDEVIDMGDSDGMSGFLLLIDYYHFVFWAVGDSGAIDDDVESHSSSRSRKNSTQVHGEERYIELSPAASVKTQNLEQRMKKVEKKLDKLRFAIVPSQNAKIRTGHFFQQDNDK